MDSNSYATVGARMLMAMVFLLNGFGIIDQKIPAREMLEHGAPEAIVPLLMWAGRLLEIIAEFALVFGFYQRYAALALLAFLIPATFVSHAFWTAAGTPAFQGQLINFSKNVAIWGGLLFIAGTAVRDVPKPFRVAAAGCRLAAMSETREPISPMILLTMTASTGIIDAVSVLAMGHVFTANMTGNVVFTGFALAGAPDFSVPRSMAALIFFLLGAGIGGRLATGMSTKPVNRWIASAFGIDGLILLTAACVSYAVVDATYIIIGLTALAMGIRIATVRKLGVADLTTAVLTLTITGLAADSSFAGGTNPRWQRRIASVLFMFAGAAIGALIVKYSASAALSLCGAGSLVCAFLAYIQKR